MYNFHDPVFDDFVPDFHKSDEAKADMSVHPEFRKMLYSTLPERDPHHAFSIKNEMDAQYYEGMQTLALGYYKAKEQFFDDAFENQLQLTTKEFWEKGE